MPTLFENIKFDSDTATDATPGEFNDRLLLICDAIRKAGPLGLSTSTDVVYVDEDTGNTEETPAYVYLEAKVDVDSSLLADAELTYTLESGSDYGSLYNVTDGTSSVTSIGYYKQVAFLYEQGTFTGTTEDTTLITIMVDIAFPDNPEYDQTAGGSFNLAILPAKGDPAVDELIADVSISEYNPVLDLLDDTFKAPVYFIDTTLESEDTHTATITIEKQDSSGTYSITELAETPFVDSTTHEFTAKGRYKVTVTATAGSDTSTCIRYLNVQPFSAFNLHPLILNPKDPRPPVEVKTLTTTSGYIDDIDDIAQYVDLHIGQQWSSFTVTTESEKTVLTVVSDSDITGLSDYTVHLKDANDNVFTHTYTVPAETETEEDLEMVSFYFNIENIINTTGTTYKIYLSEQVAGLTGGSHTGAALTLSPGAESYTVSLAGVDTAYSEYRTLASGHSDPVYKIRINNVPTSEIESGFTARIFTQVGSRKSAVFTKSISHSDSVDFNVAAKIRRLEGTIEDNNLTLAFGHEWTSSINVVDQTTDIDVVVDTQDFSEISGNLSDYSLFVKIGSTHYKYNNASSYFPIDSLATGSTNMTFTIPHDDDLAAAAGTGLSGSVKLVPVAQLYSFEVSGTDSGYYRRKNLLANDNDPPTYIMFENIPEGVDETEFTVTAYAFENGLFSNTYTTTISNTSPYASADNISVAAEDLEVTPRNYGTELYISSVTYGTGVDSDDLKGFNLKWATADIFAGAIPDATVDSSTYSTFVAKANPIVAVNAPIHRQIKFKLTPVYRDGHVSGNTVYKSGKTGEFTEDKVNQHTPISIQLVESTTSDDDVLFMFPIKKPIYITDLTLTAPAVQTGSVVFSVGTISTSGEIQTAIDNNLVLNTSTTVASSDLSTAEGEGVRLDAGEYIGMVLESGQNYLVTGNYTLTITYNG